MNKIYPVFLVFVLMLSGCGGKNDSEQRDTSSPEKALIGHWQSDDGEDMYFSKDGKLLVMLDELTQLRCKKYVVSDQNAEERTIHYSAKSCVVHTRVLSLENKGGYNSARVELQFSPDYKNAFGTITKLPDHVEEALTLNYIDSRQQP